ncbi:anhydro-N-acetylmuramic acid kinase [Curvibacter sp. CHRR-16]|uniref:anhydro-N-acetylmuramic acid kinase n=1 Tax=Curvibacter sp. CHRR-16 TaxID=2835872 RepID=UPI001BDB3EA4|nr:anhydro-N-acetylmuramic acid kinase [Curvibacter sp. CHRR-16]MBT0569889.1 anhydro-N-acetylmuramic acid kinase [Curvibacter sp. CHRR-16]
MRSLYIGLMTGTSLDGVDATLVDFSTSEPHVLGHITVDYPADLRSTFTELNSPGNNELHRAALAGNALARLYAQAVQQLLDQCGCTASQVQAIGAHGQTIRHQPHAWDGTGYTLQINQPALLAELSGIDVVADFRSRDIAAGGQGAPLVPPFHASVWGRIDATVAVLNWGGIANVSLLPRLAGAHTPPVLGFDCGPANTLLDQWCQRHTGQVYDAGGHWAASGQVHQGLLEQMLQEPFFARPAPKSTGRDLFHLDWLDQHLSNWPAIAPADVQATLAELTAISSAQAIAHHAMQTREVIVCGGGAYNLHLLARLQQNLERLLGQASGKVLVIPSDARGIPAQQVEAVAFAWLAWRHVLRQPASWPSVTGAHGARVLGALYPA